MTDKDILRMARDSGLTDPDLGEWMIDYGRSEDQIKKFAEFVEAFVREEIARRYEAQPHVEFFGRELADEIRARGAA